MLHQEKLILTKDKVFSTIQGEGLYSGVPSTFIRLSGCNLRCSWVDQGKKVLCDTPYSSFYPENEAHTVKEIVNKVKTYSNNHIVITGGEPFLQENLKELVNELDSLAYFVTIETNGTLYFPTKAHFFSISPKIHLNPQDSLNFQALKKFLELPHQLKFVVNEPHDIKIISELHEALSKSSIRKVNTYLMPQGVTKESIDEKLKWIVPMALEYGFAVSDRLHLRLWGKQRGI